MTRPRLFELGPTLCLAGIGRASTLELTDLHRLYPHSGLVLTEVMANGSALHLSIAVPDDLLGFADLQSVGLLKPVCLPLQITHLGPSRIHSCLRTDPAARRLADTVLKALNQSTHPATT